MHEMPPSVRPALRRLTRRLALGVFLDVWPAWAVASLLVAGTTALGCRMFVPGASPYLRWFWLAPLIAAAPALAISTLRAYRPADVIAVADSLSGGSGMLLAVMETRDPAWIESALLQQGSAFAMPRVRPWRRLGLVTAAALFLGAALWMPQRAPRRANSVAAEEIAGRLNATVVEMKQQQLITPADEKTLDDEIERIRRGADTRMDASAWEAADALKEKLAADVAEKQNALKWAADSLAHYSAAAQAGASDPGAQASAAELASALEKLARTGLLAGAPGDLQKLMKGGKLPADPKVLRG